MQLNREANSVIRGVVSNKVKMNEYDNRRLLFNFLWILFNITTKFVLKIFNTTQLIQILSL